MLFQNANLIDTLTVDQNARLAQQINGAIDRNRIDQLIDVLGIDRRRSARPAQLSGGELVRAGLAVALANAPVVLLADEPTGEVDSETEQRVLVLLRGLVERGLAAVIVTHSDAVAATADRVLHLVDGQVAA
jgi:putative ABC transport system ATP-binding protein